VATTTTTQATTTTAPPPRSFSMAFTGDVLVHRRVNEVAAAAGQGSGRAFDFRPMFGPIRPWIEAVDWKVCHLEVTLAADSTGLSGYPRFRSPAELAHDLAEVGFDSCSTASNHSLDFGASGLVETADVLEAAGLRFTGTARSEAEEWASRWYELAGVRAAHLSYSYGFNGLAPPADRPWMVRAIDEARILADAARARAEGAEFVVLSLHWGDEYVHAPNRMQAEMGRRLLASPDVDLIIGHHAHVVQPIDRIDGEWLVYGVGNLVSNMTQPVRRDQLLVRVDVQEQPDGSFAVPRLEVVPLYLDNATLTVMPSGPGLRPPDLDADLAAELDRSWARTVAVLEQGSGWGEVVVSG
jgi:poly-gamma-glutamate synthesis protein (capsule biosynthesis protein)